MQVVMGSLTCADMRQLEEVAFRQGATAEDLMQKAGTGIARAVLRRYPKSGESLIRGRVTCRSSVRGARANWVSRAARATAWVVRYWG